MTEPVTIEHHDHEDQHKHGEEAPRSVLSFRGRVLLTFCGILIISQFVFFAMYDQRNIANANKVVMNQLDTTLRVFETMLQSRFERLTEIVGLLASDFGFRSAVSMAENNTIRSMLANHALRVKADVIITFDTEGSFTNSYPPIEQEHAVSAFEGVFVDTDIEALIGDKYFSLVMLDNVPYQIVLIPVKAPQLIAYVAVGFKLTGDFAAHIKDITNSDVSFLVYDKRHYDSGSQSLERLRSLDRTRLLVSTNISPYNADVLIEKLPFRKDTTGFFSFRLLGDDYVAYMSPLISNHHEAFYAVMQRSWEEVLQPYVAHRPFMLLMAGGFLLVSVFIGILLSRQVTRPVLSLMDAVQQVEKGNYNEYLKLERQDEIGMLMMGFNRMIAGLAERDKMKYLALHDGLTGLPNRRQFNDRVDRAIRLQNEENIISAVLLIDLDRFKPVNDTYGHAAGDAVLKEVASRISLNSLREDDLAARLGGDEFAVLFDGIRSAEVIKRKAKEILININKPIVYQGNTIQMGASIGIAMTCRNITHSRWLERADSACYNAKKNGKNAYSFEGEEPISPLMEKE